jgi:cell filamentation protein, protein adenylyltransferase
VSVNEGFLRGVIDVAGSAVETTRRLLALVEQDRQRIHSLGRAAASSARLHDLAAKRVVFRIPEAAKMLDLTAVTVAAATRHLEELGIFREVTGRRRNRLYAYDRYLAVLREGTELP